MAELNLALIGCGNLGRAHASCVARIPEARFIAYADVVEEKARAFLDEFGGEYATADPGRVLADRRVAAVYIATRHDSHSSLAVAAAKAGKHVFIEKPLALSMEECERVARAVAEHGICLMVGLKMRYYPLVRRAHEFIPNPQVIVGQMMDNRWPDTIWAQDPIQGGANVHSQGCHTTDILRYFAGAEPRRLWAAGGAKTHPGHPCIDQCVASVEFENGAVASWIQGDAGPAQFTSKFFFELFADGKSVQLYDRLKKATFFDGEKAWTEECAEEEGLQLENEDFVSALLAGRSPTVTVEDGLAATRLVMAAERAIRTGEVQEL